MRPSEITRLCEGVATATSLPVEWVQYHVDQRAGRSCSRCDGTGVYARGQCFRCDGTGGKVTPETVAEALAWVQDNVLHVRELAAKRAEAAKEQRRKVSSEAVRWKREHGDLWELLEDLNPSDFKSSVIEAVEKARVTEKQKEALERMVEAKKKAREAPPIGTLLDLEVSLSKYGYGRDGRGNRVFQLEFVAEGWAGRVEIADEAHGSTVLWMLRGRDSTTVHIKASVVWRRGGFAILGGDSIEIR